MSPRVVLLFRAALALAAFIPAALLPPVANADARDPVNVFAASSLTDVVGRIAAGYCESAGRSPGCVRGVFGASSTLARQVAQGAPADVYLTADGRWMDFLESAGRLRSEERIAFAGNRLAVIQSRPGPPSTDVAGALGNGRIALGDPGHVPAGIYARESLSNLGLWAAVEPRIVPADNARHALLLVARGEVAAGIVYRSDALASPRVHLVALLPAESHAPIRYHAAPVTGSGAQASDFVRYLAGPAARAQLEDFGFGDGVIAHD